MKLIVIVCCVLLSANLSAQQTAIEWFDKGNVALAAGENAKAVMAFTESLAEMCNLLPTRTTTEA